MLLCGISSGIYKSMTKVSLRGAGLANLDRLLRKEKKMKRKGFTLVELLVVIAIIALLMGILMPALAKVRQVAYRLMCGTNLAGIGKAMLVYSNENSEEYPIAGGTTQATWTSAGTLKLWQHTRPDIVFGRGARAEATITSSLYLLIRRAEVAPKLFNCKGDMGSRIFKLSDTITDLRELSEAWDFGAGQACPMPGEYCSYSYHMPYKFGGGRNPINSASNSACPVAADRNPYLDKNANPRSGQGYIDNRKDEEGIAKPSWSAVTTEVQMYYDPDKTGNAFPHQRDGQNVLFNDGHVAFCKYPNVGVDNDNIWKCWEKIPLPEPADMSSELGKVPYYGVLTGTGLPGLGPLDQKDAFLVNEDNRWD